MPALAAASPAARHSGAARAKKRLHTGPQRNKFERGFGRGCRLGAKTWLIFQVYDCTIEGREPFTWKLSTLTWTRACSRAQTLTRTCQIWVHLIVQDLSHVIPHSSTWSWTTGNATCWPWQKRGINDSENFTWAFLGAFRLEPQELFKLNF